MNLAIKLWENITNSDPILEIPSGIPGEWPALVKELGNSTELPNETYILMTEEEYEAYKESKQGLYNSWIEG